MINRNKTIALNAILAMTILLAFSGEGLAQSGGASLRGWVAFENVAYVDKQPRAKVVLQHDPPGSGPAYTTETDEHGFFEFPHTSLGRFKLEITAKGFQPVHGRRLYAVGFCRQLGCATQGRSTKAPMTVQILDFFTRTTDYRLPTTRHRVGWPSVSVAVQATGMSLARTQPGQTRQWKTQDWPLTCKDKT